MKWYNRNREGDIVEKEMYHVNTVRKPFLTEKRRDEIIENYYRKQARKERCAVVGRKVGTITATTIAIATIGLMATLGPDYIASKQTSQLAQANYELDQNAYHREITEDVIRDANRDYYISKKEEALEKMKSLTPGTAEYYDTQQLLDEYELELMGYDEIIKDEGRSR